jgi:hypothetical protein
MAFPPGPGTALFSTFVQEASTGAGKARLALAADAFGGGQAVNRTERRILLMILRPARVSGALTETLATPSFVGADMTASRKRGPSARSLVARRPTVSLHRASVHVLTVERYAGHTGILRELIDGSVGFGPRWDNLAPGDKAWWASYRDKVAAAAHQAGNAT